MNHTPGSSTCQWAEFAAAPELQGGPLHGGLFSVETVGAKGSELVLSTFQTNSQFLNLCHGNQGGMGVKHVVSHRPHQIYQLKQGTIIYQYLYKDKWISEP